MIGVSGVLKGCVAHNILNQFYIVVFLREYSEFTEWTSFSNVNITLSMLLKGLYLASYAVKSLKRWSRRIFSNAIISRTKGQIKKSTAGFFVEN